MATTIEPTKQNLEQHLDDLYGLLYHLYESLGGYLRVDEVRQQQIPRSALNFVREKLDRQIALLYHHLNRKDRAVGAELKSVAGGLTGALVGLAGLFRSNPQVVALKDTYTALAGLDANCLLAETLCRQLGRSELTEQLHQFRDELKECGERLQLALVSSIEQDRKFFLEANRKEQNFYD